MNKIKQLPKRKSFFVVATLILSMLLVATYFMGMKPDTSPNVSALSLGRSGNPEDVTITIDKPSGWKTKETPINITVESTLRIVKVEAKTSSNGSYINITDDMQVEISENCTVYIQVMDNKGKVYAKSRYIEIFDREAPTAKATVTKTMLRVETSDNLSGVSTIYIDGEAYSNLTNGTVDIRLKDIGKKYPEIEIQAVDSAGNKSKIVTVKNPNYKDESTDLSLGKESKTTGTATTTSTTEQSGTATTTPTAQQNGTATATNTTAPTSSTAGSSTTENSGSSDGGSGESSDTVRFGTFEDTNKQFMSIVTADGAVYYMIIDHDKESENVYLLNTVTNADLASFTPEGAIAEETEQAEEYPEYIENEPKEEVSFIDEQPDPTDEEAENSNDNIEQDEAKEEVPSEQPKGGSPGTSILIILALLGVGGAGFYFKIYKPKQEAEEYDDLDDFEFAEDNDNLGSEDFDEGDNFMFED